MDERKAERVRESVRTGLAKALAATAEGLATVSRAAASTAAQLRPPEPARDRQRSEDGQQRPSARGTADAREAAPEAAASGPASGGSAPAPDSQATASEQAAPRQGEDDEVADLVERNAREVIAEVSGLDAAQLRRLRAAEQQGKARKTVLAAIDRALQ